MTAKDLEVANLRLDEENPRHDSVSGERALIAAMFEGLGASRTVKLAEHIVANGMSPTDNMLVISNGDGSYTSVEGNRRLTVLKLLADPSLAPTKKHEATFERLKGELVAPITHVSAAEMKDREDARPWILLRHDGPADGASVVDWDAVQKQRFTGKAGEVQLALLVMGSLKATYPADTKLIADLEKIEKRNPTTLGRLPKDGGVRALLGLNKGDPLTSSLLTPSELAEVWAQVASDLAAGDKTVSDLKKSKQMTDYVKTLMPANLIPAAPSPVTTATPPGPVSSGIGTAPATPPAPLSAPEPEPTSPPTGSEPATSPPAGPSPRFPVQPTPKYLFEGLILTKVDNRTRNVVRELQQLDVEKFPNACAALTRVLIELVVFEVVAAKGWAGQTLREKVKTAVYELDRTSKDLRYEAVRVGLQDGTSMFAVNTIQAWMHNQHFHAVPSEVRANAANYKDFLAALDALL